MGSFIALVVTARSLHVQVGVLAVLHQGVSDVPHPEAEGPKSRPRACRSSSGSFFGYPPCHQRSTYGYQEIIVLLQRLPVRCHVSGREGN